jgi:6-methylsalicylate decarboxylase
MTAVIDGRVASRRAVLSGCASLVMAAAMPYRAHAQSGGPRIIDTHHHFFPPGYLAGNLDRIVKAGSLPASAYTNWSPNWALEQMDKGGVETALVSITTPGVWFDDGIDPARKRARICNEFGAKMKSDHGRRFGMFAAVPLPDRDGSLTEVAYALDDLKLDGVGVLTSYDGKFLGDSSFAPAFEELNRRKTVVFVHPTMTCCAGNLFPGVSQALIEYPADTARTMASLAASGAFARFPNITFVFSHGGGVVPSIYQRLGGIERAMSPEDRARKLPKGLDYELKRQYYDTASVGTSPPGMAAVLKLWPITQITYGSDTPFGTTTSIADGIKRVGLSAPHLHAIQRGNAARLFPHFA